MMMIGHLQHLFPAHVLIDERGMVGDKSLSDFVEDNPAVTALNRTHIRIDNQGTALAFIFALQGLHFLFTVN